jgi:hypothetical protein
MSGGPLADRSRRIALVSLFAVIIFGSKVILPPPSDDAFVFVQVMLLLLSTFLMGAPGATYVSTLSGVLKSLATGSFAPFTVGLAVMYGLMVDGFVLLLRARPKGGSVSYPRVMGAATLSTAIEGLLGYLITVPIFQLPVPSGLLIDASILIGGTFSGVIGGWLAAFIWKRYLFPRPAGSPPDDMRKGVTLTTSNA